MRVSFSKRSLEINMSTSEIIAVIILLVLIFYGLELILSGPSPSPSVMYNQVSVTGVGEWI